MVQEPWSVSLPTRHARMDAVTMRIALLSQVQTVPVLASLALVVLPWSAALVSVTMAAWQISHDISSSISACEVLSVAP